MDIIQFAADIVNAIARHGWSVTTFVVAVTALFRVNAIRRMLLKRLPRRFRHEDRLDSIQRDIKAIKAHLGVLDGWDAHFAQVSKSQGVTDGQKSNSRPTWVMRVPARIIGVFTMRTVHSNRFKTRGESIRMKNKLLSRKFLMALISAALVIANDGLNLGLDSNTIIAFGSIVVGWIIGEAAVDVARKPQGGKGNADFETPIEPRV